MATPLELVQAQLKAYNARDLEAFCRVFSDDVETYTLKDNQRLLRGQAAFRKLYESLFADSPHLHAEVNNRIVLGDFVIDHETVTGRRNENLEAIAIYKITDEKISHVWFALK